MSATSPLPAGRVGPNILGCCCWVGGCKNDMGWSRRLGTMYKRVAANVKRLGLWWFVVMLLSSSTARYRAARVYVRKNPKSGKQRTSKMEGQRSCVPDGRYMYVPLKSTLTNNLELTMEFACFLGLQPWASSGASRLPTQTHANRGAGSSRGAAALTLANGLDPTEPHSTNKCSRFDRQPARGAAARQPRPPE